MIPSSLRNDLMNLSVADFFSLRRKNRVGLSLFSKYCALDLILDPSKKLSFNLSILPCAHLILCCNSKDVPSCSSKENKRFKSCFACFKSECLIRDNRIE